MNTMAGCCAPCERIHVAQRRPYNPAPLVGGAFGDSLFGHRRAYFFSAAHLFYVYVMSPCSRKKIGATVTKKRIAEGAAYLNARGCRGGDSLTWQGAQRLAA